MSVCRMGADDDRIVSGPCVSFIGQDLKGRDKWLGGELGADGIIYGISLWAAEMLEDAS